MEKIDLKDLVEKEGAAKVASKLGCSAPAILKAVKSGRNVYVTVLEDGTYEAKEIKDFPSQRHPSKPDA